jgi:hypothetical protein
MPVFSIELPGDQDDPAWKGINELMDALQDEHVAYVKHLAKELGVSEDCASDVAYLRTRSRHSSELESKLIELHKVGTPPNINEFGCSR